MQSQSIPSPFQARNASSKTSTPRSLGAARAIGAVACTMLIASCGSLGTTTYRPVYSSQPTVDDTLGSYATDAATATDAGVTHLLEGADLLDAGQPEAAHAELTKGIDAMEEHYVRCAAVYTELGDTPEMASIVGMQAWVMFYLHKTRGFAAYEQSSMDLFVADLKDAIAWHDIFEPRASSADFLDEVDAQTERDAGLCHAFLGVLYGSMDGTDSSADHHIARADSLLAQDDPARALLENGESAFDDAASGSPFRAGGALVPEFATIAQR